MTNKYNLAKIVFYSLLFLLYFVYTIYGILIITNDYSFVVCQHLWIYVLWLSGFMPYQVREDEVFNYNAGSFILRMHVWGIHNSTQASRG